jgi:predicted CDP-diglyceride synthetase/phosphatidate cytidylyltransferase
MKKKSHYIILIFSGLLLILLGIIYQITNLSNELISLIIINVGIILVVVSVLKFNNFGAGLKQDERTRKLSLKALSYSWLITFLTINIIFWINFFNIINFTFSNGIAILLFVMIFSATGLQFIYKKRGILNED